MPLPDTNAFFREMTLRICGSLEIEQALYRSFAYLRGIMPVDLMVLSHFDATSGIQQHLAEATAAGGKRLEMATPLSPETLAAVKAQISAGTLPPIEIFSHPETHPITRLAAAQWDIPDGSLLVIRLIPDGTFLGVVAFVAGGRNRYHAEHAALLDLLREPFAVALSNYVRYREILELKELLSDDNQYLQAELQRLSGSEIIGADFGLRDVMDLVRQVAPLSSPVLLLGETGTGKELIAGALHQSSPRRNGPFIKVNCGAIPLTLIDSELFGHERGAFTGALSQKRGRFERAHGGTLFLDEIGELPPDAQVRLLRVVQEKELERVGGSHPIPVDVRIIAATHRDLRAMIAAGTFREDLYFRLNVFPLTIPPLRERCGDIPVLVQHFIRKKAREMKRTDIPALALGALDRLREYPWPGNVRELENVVERALILNRGGLLTFADLPAAPGSRPAPAPQPPGEALLDLDALNARHIRRVLEMTAGRIEGQGGAAELLGIKPNTLRHRLRKLGLPFGRAAKAARLAGP